MEDIIQVESLQKSFSGGTAIEDMTFSVKKAEIFGFLGPSGAGKTTTIKILTGQLAPSSGKADVFGVLSTSINDPAYLQKLGVMTDNSGLYQRLSVYDNLKLYCELYGISKEKIPEELESLALQNDSKKIVSNLSKGMTQRVILARALLHEPELLFLDEPTAALDPSTSMLVHKKLRDLNERGTTIFLTTHDMNEAEQLCDRVAFLSQGRIQLLDEPKRLRRQFSDQTMTLELKNNKHVVVKNSPESAEEVYQYMTTGEIISIRMNEPSLGDIFVHVTGRALL
ncbi:ABC transporter ATP-binding protein [Salibacterium lacus]|uniref:ATP-binding cassette domain-containing protein n=1 Tax=Salibacterium lacus TaxID=1898109 RepID=A0ABW5T6N5_9BACI